MTELDRKIISEFESLPQDYWDFKCEDTKKYTHGIHNYPAMMISPISKNIIRIMSKYIPIQSILDPFSGSGTVLVESMLAGIPTIYGNDINPLALFLTKAKTTPLDTTELQKEVENLCANIQEKLNTYSKAIFGIDDCFKDTDLTTKDGYGKDAPEYIKAFCDKNGISIEVPSFKNLGYWFKPKMVIILQIIKEEILKIEDKDIRDYIFVAFSESIRFVSNRRNGEFKMFRMPPEKVRTFNIDVFQTFKKILDKNVKRMKEFVKALSTTPSVVITNNNACTLEDVPNNFFDLIVTSPPYGDSRTTVAYGEYSRLSLQWLNLETEENITSIDKTLMGGKKYKNSFNNTLPSETLKASLDKIEEKDKARAGDVYSFYDDLNKSIKAVADKTKTDGYQFWVVGNRTVKGELLQTDKIIAELAKQYSMEYIYTIDRNIPSKSMPSLNSPTNITGEKVTTMTTEHIVVLKKTKEE